MVAFAIVGGAAAFWFRPFVVETFRDDGSPRTRFVLRRNWRGEWIAHGDQTWFLRDGSPLKSTTYGARLEDDKFDESDGDKIGNADFNYLIWLVDDTIAPDHWSDQLSLEPGSEQRIESDNGDRDTTSIIE